jgi:hypothetical protein
LGGLFVGTDSAAEFGVKQVAIRIGRNTRFSRACTPRYRIAKVSTAS